ncbi:hypothetical protein [Paenibacillus sp. NAIST15-1]|uniref:hypothetical protein n=1 Tax=Paenibacillus sp. NAIST15-1 TaxID=1605994 RepID=UPI000869AD34|nr:hypothetical protein [Paenibacillus sp. NAIST15-1]GAV11406.1 hypothetical protein PBN151_1335 [Paenibacillus sp. NAIST15-1]
MNEIKIKRELLEKYGLPDCGINGVKLIRDDITDNSRWSIHHEIIFKWTDGKFYRAYYSVGATESQDEAPWEYEDEVECVEVYQVEKMVKVWEDVL